MAGSAKKTLAILFGGRSAEYEVSINTANCVLEAIDKELYNIVLIGITQKGVWATGKDAEEMLTGKIIDPKERILIPADPEKRQFVVASGDKSSIIKQIKQIEQIDIVFPLLHGSYGEDGTVQGLLEMAGIPYVGSGVTASALAMDKILTKNILIANGVPVVKSVHFSRYDWQNDKEYLLDVLKKNFEIPCFVKPANAGSSVGITKVKDYDKIPQAVEFALKYDRKVLIEKAIMGKEIEVSVLGNDPPLASVPGQIIPGNEFYDYEAKYKDAGSRLKIPAPLDKTTIQKIREMALVVFKCLDCNGMARVDFFIEDKTDNIFVNEVNTIPGFTPISMYPKLWEASGISYTELVNKLIEFAFERWEDKQQNSISF